MYVYAPIRSGIWYNFFPSASHTYFTHVSLKLPFAWFLLSCFFNSFSFCSMLYRGNSVALPSAPVPSIDDVIKALSGSLGPNPTTAGVSHTSHCSPAEKRGMIDYFSAFNMNNDCFILYLTVLEL